MRIICLLIFSLLLFSGALAQDTISVSTFCYSYGDSIAVRWQPYNKTGWMIGKANGYKLTRFTYQEGKLVKTENLGIFNFLPKARWKNLLATNPYAAVPYKAAYEYKSPITNLNNINNVLSKNKEEENIFIFNLFYASFNFEVATAMGLGYMDRDIKRGDRYQYKIEYVNPESYVQTHPVVAEVAAYSKSKLPVIDSLAIETEDSRATLRWNFIDYEEKYNAYFIERSEDEGKNFTQMNTTPFIPLVDDIYGDPDTRYIYFNDDSLTNNITYHYRIRGISSFGDVGPPSNIVAGTPKTDPISAEPIITDVWENEEGHFKVSWFFNPTYLDQVEYFEVLKSDGRSSPHQKIKNSKIFPNQPLTFTDTSPNKINFYKIKAMDIHQNEIYSISVLGQLQDKSPPNPPVAIQGSCDTNGVVTIFWSNNQEADLAGYYVYSANIEEGDYSMLTRTGGVQDSVYLDTVGLNHPSERNFYKVVAYDFRGNQSDFSEAILIKLPDRWPPVKPVFKRHKTQIDQLFLEWTNSSSYDIAKNILQRRIKDSLIWTPLVIDPSRGTTVSFLDSTVTFKHEYEYRIQAMDDDSLVSFSDTLVLKPLDSRERDHLSSFYLNFDKEKRQIRLSWGLDIAASQIKKISIFRGEEEELMVPYKTLYDFPTESNSREFYDKEIKAQKRYQYKLVIRYKNGTFSSSNIKNILTE